MTKEELLAELEEATENLDTECAHGDADDALLEYIGDTDIAEVYNRVPKWYA